MACHSHRVLGALQANFKSVHKGLWAFNVVNKCGMAVDEFLHIMNDPREI
jgi:hypothetical protein